MRVVRIVLVLGVLVAFLAVPGGEAGDAGGQAFFATPTPIPTPAPTYEDVQVRLTTLAPITKTFTAPVALAEHPVSGEMYVLSKVGVVHRLTDGGTEVVLDISHKVTNNWEQGALGLTFSPDGLFMYLDYVDTDENTWIGSYLFLDGKPDTRARRTILEIEQDNEFHQAGTLEFGSDGYLYIATGDGGIGADPEDKGQRTDTLLGKILRIDPNPAGEEPYAIPPGNPFRGDEDAAQEIWHRGLRNPWRFTFDRETQDMWITDVGTDDFEEIDVAPASAGGGLNFGWSRFEGPQRFRDRPVPQDHRLPVYSYPHTVAEGRRNPTAAAIIGAVRYRGTAIPALRGAVVFGDFYDGHVQILRMVDGELTDHRVLDAIAPELTSVTQDRDGALYLLSFEEGVLRIDP